MQVRQSTSVLFMQVKQDLWHDLQVLLWSKVPSGQLELHDFPTFYYTKTLFGGHERQSMSLSLNYLCSDIQNVGNPIFFMKMNYC